MSFSEESNGLTTIRAASKEEKRLLKDEYEAERALVEAREELTQAIVRLKKEEERVAKRRADVAEAIDTLRQAQEARATGPRIAERQLEAAAAPENEIPPKDDSTTN